MGPEEITALDEKIQDLREDITITRGEEKLLRASLTALSASMSTTDLRASLLGIHAQRQAILTRLEPLRSGTVKPVFPKEKAEVDQAWKIWNHRASTRKKICMEVWAMATEEMPEGKTKEELWVGSSAYQVEDHALTVL